MAAPARVLHLIATNFYGGPEKQIVEHLSRLSPEKYSGAVASFIENERKNEIIEVAEERGIEHFAIPMSGPLDISAVRGLRAELKKRKIDIFCMHGYKANVIGYLAALWLPLTTVAFSRGYTAEDWKVAFYEWVERKFIGRHDGLVAVSHGQLRRVLALGVRPRLTWVVHNAVAIAAAKEVQRRCDPQEIRQDLGISAAETMVVSSGRLSIEKGHRFLLEAIALLPTHIRNKSVFVFCGEGVCHGQLERQAAKLGVAERCRFTGFRSDILELYFAMDLMALPSLTEGFPNVILEAFSLAKPVVSTAVGGVPELVEEGVSGLLVEPGNPQELAVALASCIENPDTAKKHGANGYETVESRFTFEAQNTKLEKIYKQLSRGVRSTARATVLTFHGISPSHGEAPELDAVFEADRGAKRYVVTEETLDSILASLKPEQVCTVDEFSKKTGEEWTVLTFDDGLATDYSLVFPKLLKAGLRATFYVSADNIGRSGYTTECQLREMHDAGMEIGSHGFQHRYLPPLNAEESRSEIESSRARIGEVIGTPVTSYAPVGGHFSARNARQVWEAGYSTFATMEPGKSGGRSGQLVLLRNHIQADDPPERVKRIVRGAPITLFINRLRYFALLIPKKVLGLRGYDKLKELVLPKKAESGAEEDYGKGIGRQGR